MIVVDTSALFAVVDAHDDMHAAAIGAAAELAESDAPLAISNYAVAEVLSLVSRRLGRETARVVQRNAIAPADVLWTSPLEHAAAVELFLESGRSLSFVDCATMAVMRARGLRTIFTFDDDFARAGFDVVPAVA